VEKCERSVKIKENKGACGHYQIILLKTNELLSKVARLG